MIRSVGRFVLVSVLGGVLVGVVVGGLGSRLSMRLTAALTDGPAFTLTGAEVGVVSLDGTLSLLVSAAQAGAIAGLFYAAARWTLPAERRSLAIAVLFLLLPGGAFMGDDEFRLFTPSLLTVALFLPLFPAGAFALDTIVERIDPASRSRGRIAQHAFTALIALGIAVFGLNFLRLF